MANDLLTKTENAPVPKYDNMAAGYQSALQLVEDVVLKSYISGLSDLDIVPLSQSVLDTNLEENVLFRWSMRKKNLHHINLPVCLTHWPLPMQGFSLLWIAMEKKQISIWEFAP